MKIMDGGRLRWVEEGRPLTTDTPTYPAGNITLEERDDRKIRAFREEVLAHLKKKGQLVDVRSPEEFRGERTHMPDYPQEGHVSGWAHPRCQERPLGQGGGPRHPHLPARERAQASCTNRTTRSSRTARRSRIAGSASAPLIPGSRSPTCSASQRTELRWVVDRVGQRGTVCRSKRGEESQSSVISHQSSVLSYGYQHPL